MWTFGTIWIRSTTLLVIHCFVLSHCKADSQQIIVHTANGVTVRDNPLWPVRRLKRQSYDLPEMNGFSQKQKSELLARHNELRTTRRSSNMMKMDWDYTLEKSAQDWADRCVFAHSSFRKSIDGYRYVGENLYAGTAMFDPASVVQMWFDEWQFYNYNTLRCVPGQMCGHYTQVVWAESRSLGCGVRYCQHLSEAGSFDQGYNVVCHYGPGGNIIGFKPYKIGRACSECPVDAPYCTHGLCYHTQLLGSDEDNPLAEGGFGSGSMLFASLWTNVALWLCLLLPFVRHAL